MHEQRTCAWLVGSIAVLAWQLMGLALLVAGHAGASPCASSGGDHPSFQWWAPQLWHLARVGVLGMPASASSLGWVHVGRLFRMAGLPNL